MSELGKAEEAAALVRSRATLRPALGVVLGSGLGAFAASLDSPTVIPYGEIPHFPRSTAIGHGGELVLGRCRGVAVAVMSGRVHLYEGYTPQQVVFPVRVLGRLGVRTLVLTNAAGSVNPHFRPGELMVIEDHINFLGSNPLVGPNEEELGERFFDMSAAYDPELREIAARALAKAGFPARKGVYIAFSGPSYETPAEIRMARTMGADAVGMSTVPEVLAARHMGIRVLGISCLTNMAAGVVDQKLDHREVLEVGERVKSGLMEVLAQVIEGAVQHR
ncbi:MAG TPA: purine-nucleoside phosphorylase [Vicinamibacteria bacterium]|nr:purine-nucleoside phosphorylase [Vicinamibacteria bacterium]